MPDAQVPGDATVLRSGEVELELVTRGRSWSFRASGIPSGCWGSQGGSGSIGAVHEHLLPRQLSGVLDH